ncbi:hypothetical protein BJ875DRAFT_212886 [Amylocarpus encephaloides]|uniref:Regulatory P domain-containing protein n=1 Tax=Amylocarpus encephaloides TaxID=45428 RepID=A0A9P7YMR1_9HELO|nr:hypothetical protein BJ875DRAFT_212886 [Amylocarpus encephaloides]
MKPSLILAVAGLAQLASSTPILESRVFSAAMGNLMSLKLAHRASQRASGVFTEEHASLLATTKCVNGKASEYACSAIDMASFLSHQALGSNTREGNDVWGWTSSTGREFGIVGQTDGVAFVEVKSDGSLTYLGRLPTQTANSVWRDIKVIGDFAYIGSEASRHGLQVFDMRKLLPLTAAKTFRTSTDLTARYSGFGNSHNLVANEATKTIFAVGSNTCAGGLHMVDVSTPSAPRSAGCVSQDGYVHDAQCVVYTGVDTRYTGREICFNFNEDTLTIVDVTVRAAPVQLSRTSYGGVAYTHQGWLATSDMRYLLLDDELDEQSGSAGTRRTTTYVVDVGSLTAPRFTGKYLSPVNAIDHNQYVVDGLSYQSNYGSGLRIVDVTSVASDPTGKGFKQVGFFDVNPGDDASTGQVQFVGSWSVYPYFKSGYLLLNSIERGIYSLKYTGA